MARGAGGWCSRSCASRARRSASRALARSCSRPPPGGCRPTRPRGCWRGWSAAHGGELLTLAGGRVTSREIRQLEQHVIDVAVERGGEGREPARRSVGRSGGRLAAARGGARRRQALGPRAAWQAFELLVQRRRVGVPHRPGGNRARDRHCTPPRRRYRAAGWRVIACAMDGTTARRMAEQLGGTSARADRRAAQGPRCGRARSPWTRER